jgi:hypothetical protein
VIFEATGDQLSLFILNPILSNKLKRLVLEKHDTHRNSQIDIAFVK